MIKISLNSSLTEKKHINLDFIYNLKKLIQIKHLIIVIAALILSKNILASSSVFAYCGKKAVCQYDGNCTMIDGDYSLFKSFSVGSSYFSGTFPLSRVFVWNYPKSRRAACFYETPKNISVQFVSFPSERFGIAMFYPATAGWVYNDPETIPSTGENVYSCDASKYECRMEHLPYS